MVLRHHGHWYRLDPAAQSPLQWVVAVLYLRRDVRSEHRLIQPLPVHLDCALFCLPGDLERDGAPSGTVALSRYGPDGSCNDYKHDCFCLRSDLGVLGNHFGKAAICY